MRTTFWIIVLIILSALVYSLYRAEQLNRSFDGKEAVFNCADGKTIGATFYPQNDTHVDLQLSDGRFLSVPRALSASGARYATFDESFVFWNKGDSAFVVEGSTTTYTDCITNTR